uniref:Putative LAGLIDADG homing endonuclease n=1 Tax=Closterium baillyanum TaxID=1416941 RepID=U5YGL6_9VIRI|nr:putative LAGLIDADG homing endonuclease [Closterium baillyanum]AGZ90270.1 putative LAGLIDADG homing endonuclease [Closterium baillyanum]
MKKKKIEDMSPRTTKNASAPAHYALLRRRPLKSLDCYALLKSRLQSGRKPKSLGVMKKQARSAFDQISLSDHCKSIICGTLLGDGCLQLTKGCEAARLSIRHSQVQREYFDWKVANLKEIASPKSVQISKASGARANTKLLFQSASLPELTLMYNLTYKKKRLCIRRRWLNKLTPLSLAIWWCDDGSIIGHKRTPRRGVLCTDGFDEKSVRMLARYLEKVWALKAHVGAIRRDRFYGNYTKKEYFRLWFSTKELKKWLRIILPHIPVASMVYKTRLIYKDSQFQQRWISETLLAQPQFSNEIEELYSLPKKKAKH